MYGYSRFPFYGKGGGEKRAEGDKGEWERLTARETARQSKRETWGGGGPKVIAFDLTKKGLISHRHASVYCPCPTNGLFRCSSLTLPPSCPLPLPLILPLPFPHPSPLTPPPLPPHPPRPRASPEPRAGRDADGAGKVKVPGRGRRTGPATDSTTDAAPRQQQQQRGERANAAERMINPGLQKYRC